TYNKQQYGRERSPMFYLLDFKERCPKTFYLLCGMLVASFVVSAAVIFSYGILRLGAYLHQFVRWPNWLRQLLAPDEKQDPNVIWTVPPPKQDCTDKDENKNENCREQK
ncbi:MAG: hypothetical protein Q8P49_02630, partial [Candidatus Liptonbacteria bacterium]|nr:hypothetical protein [Candidatus Liptonbacteria bacterium]